MLFLYTGIYFYIFESFVFLHFFNILYVTFVYFEHTFYFYLSPVPVQLLWGQETIPQCFLSLHAGGSGVTWDWKWLELT